MLARWLTRNNHHFEAALHHAAVFAASDRDLVWRSLRRRADSLGGGGGHDPELREGADVIWQAVPGAGGNNGNRRRLSSRRHDARRLRLPDQQRNPR